MNFKFPKNDEKYSWTNHVGRKMMFYALSADRIKRVMRNPQRSEKGIAENTIAVMCPYGTSPGGRQLYKGEIWVMYAEVRQRRTSGLKLKAESLKPIKKVIITAWRYPGVSPIREAIPIPADILEELKSIKY